MAHLECLEAYHFPKLSLALASLVIEIDVSYLDLVSFDVECLEIYPG